MTLHDWEKHMTAKGITHNDAVRMLKGAEAEIEQLRAALRELTKGYRLLVNADNQLTRAAMGEFMDMAVIRIDKMLGETS